MKCGNVLSKLEIYLNRETPPAERRHIQEHLARCMNCRQELDELDVLQNRVRNSMRLLATRAFPAADSWEHIQENIYAGAHLSLNQSAHAGSPVDWQPLLLPSNWSTFCLPRSTWW